MNSRRSHIHGHLAILCILSGQNEIGDNIYALFTIARKYFTVEFTFIECYPLSRIFFSLISLVVDISFFLYLYNYFSSVVVNVHILSFQIVKVISQSCMRFMGL